VLKTTIGDQVWLISQPDHAAVSGYLIAHWGNREFAKPGHFADAQQPERLRAETIFGVAEHDNGWWEWEADPEIDPNDGLPLHLTGIAQQQSLERWRLGVPRFQASYPYAALLISFHAYWIYAHRCDAGADPVFRHPLFGAPDTTSQLEGEELAGMSSFLAGQKETQRKLIARLRHEPGFAAACEPRHLHPHVRLLQLADALSLALCFGGQQPLSLAEIPRQSWEDRVALSLSPASRNRIVCRPYPFDEDPLKVSLRARVVRGPTRPAAEFHGWWHSIPRQYLHFAYSSG